MLEAVSKKNWAKKIRSDLPILLMSGDKDPVGNYGKGVRKVYDRLAEAGVEDVTLRLYVDGRHELFNEINREEVFADINEFMEGLIQF
jgi:alpha-beta hydrolase superfamily lysophospholipase